MGQALVLEKVVQTARRGCDKGGPRSPLGEGVDEKNLQGTEEVVQHEECSGEESSKKRESSSRRDRMKLLW